MHFDILNVQMLKSKVFEAKKKCENPCTKYIGIDGETYCLFKVVKMTNKRLV